MKHTFEVTAVYKHGATLLRIKTTVVGRNVDYVQSVPEEAPEYTDGMNTRICFGNGVTFGCSESYESVVSNWLETLDSI